jgi:hypothetical protein
MELVSSMDQQHYFSVSRVTKEKNFSISNAKRGILRTSPIPKPFLTDENSVGNLGDLFKIKSGVVAPGDISPAHMKARNTSRARPSVFNAFNQINLNAGVKSQQGLKSARLNIPLQSNRIHYQPLEDLFSTSTDNRSDDFEYLFNHAYGRQLSEEVNSRVETLTTSRPTTATNTGRQSRKVAKSKIDSGRASTARTRSPGQDTFQFETTRLTNEMVKAKIEFVLTRSLNSYVLSFILLLSSRYLLTTNQPTDSLQYLIIALNLSLLFEDYFIIMQVFKSLGDYFAKIRKFEFSLIMYTRGLQRAIDTKDAAMQTIFFDLIGLTFFNLNQSQRSREFHQIMLSTLDHQRENMRISHQNRSLIKLETEDFVRYFKCSVPPDPLWKYIGMAMMIRGHIKPWFYSTSSCSLDSASAETTMFLDTLVAEMQDVVKQVQSDKLTFYLPGHNKDIADTKPYDLHRLLEHGGRSQTISTNLRRAMHINKQINKPFIMRDFTAAGEKQILESEEARRTALLSKVHMADDLPFQRTMLKTHESTNKLLAILLLETNLDDPLFSHEKYQREQSTAKRQHQSMFELLSVSACIALQFTND